MLNHFMNIRVVRGHKNKEAAPPYLPQCFPRCHIQLSCGVLLQINIPITRVNNTITYCIHHALNMTWLWETGEKLLFKN